MIVFMLRSALGDSSKNGISNRYRSCWLINEEDVEKTLDGDFPQAENTLVLIKRELWGKKAWYLIPIYLYGTNKIVMFGGNYAIGDSDFTKEISDLPLPIHDRVESQEEYDSYAD